MPKKAHTEEQIVAVLQQGQAGEKVADICRKVGISEGTYYAWKKQFAGLRKTWRQMHQFTFCGSKNLAFVESSSKLEECKMEEEETNVKTPLRRP